jgi:uroporphyrinogen decarboxylase
MRQAGRYLPEYRAVRDRKGGFLDLCYDPEAAAEVTLQPLRRFDLDAAIVFADILVLPDAMGVDVGFTTGEGPVVERVRDWQRVSRLGKVRGTIEVERVCETLGRVKGELGRSVALIGFCGAPWTVASYMIEGGSSEERLEARRAAALEPDWFTMLIGRLVEESVEYLAAQVRAGAEAVQVFDSWAGDLPWDLREKWVIAPLSLMVAEFRKLCPGVPVIVFARGVGAGQVDVARRVKPDGVSVEPSVPLGWARKVLVGDVAVQGNLDPVILSLGGDVLEESVGRVVKELPRGRHIFNLGHGIRPETDPEFVKRAVELIRKADG